MNYTNQEKLQLEMELHEGNLGLRKKPIFHDPVFLLDADGTPVYRVPTNRYRKYPKAERQPRRRLRRQRRREYLQTLSKYEK